MKIWIDDIRKMPSDYDLHIRSVNEAKRVILSNSLHISLIDIDHDAGDYYFDGGDYIRLLDWLEETRLNYPIRIHSMNPVGVQNMRTIIDRNGWEEVK